MTGTLRPSALLAIGALVITGPVMLIIGVVLLITQGSPIVFRQIRSGHNQKTFTIVKFRTMRDLHDTQGVALPDAVRTTRVGRFLRRSRLDELPELFNIFCGEMNFVGPRPLLPGTVAAMGDDGRLRGTVRPGLTGLAQVNGNTLLSTREKLDFDLRYVRERSLGLDARIIVRTLFVLINGEKRSDHGDAARNSDRSG
jgi:lipopolysaccharide/colanic/teichoic acid biosynthesis glycosyltransferase